MKKHGTSKINWSDLIPPGADAGLTKSDVEKRLALGLSNAKGEAKAKSVPAILRENLFTFFNFLNFTLGAIVLLVGSFQNALFLGVVFLNLIIGVLQQLRAKISVEKLSLIAKTKLPVLREGALSDIPVDEIVLHDILELKAGSQVPVDAEVIFGSCEADESLLTGESDPVYKEAGSELLSGSFILSGSVRAMALRVGRESYAMGIVNESRAIKVVNSEIIRSFNTLIKALSVAILILGSILFLKQYFLLKEALKPSVESTVAAVVGMIPEGLVLLTNIVLAVGVIRLSGKKILVQEMYCIETLARVDTLCVDKTGTITEGKPRVVGLQAYREDVDIEQALAEFSGAVGDQNPTALALIEYFGHEQEWEHISRVPFSPARKWSAASFRGKGSFVLGAPEVLSPGAAEAGAGAGQRVVFFARSEEEIRAGEEAALPKKMTILAAILFEDAIRPEAAEIFGFLKEEGVDVKIISGDSGKTALAVAEKAGIGGLSGFLDTYALSDEQIREAAPACSVFGRVTPAQKRLIVKSLQEAGRTVAMTGDGVNDVLALKQADCSIAVASGSDAARAISQIVLLNSNLGSIYNVIMEGRRIINNIKRSASLFLVKTIFSVLLSVIFTLLPLRYPFLPIQLTLLSSLCIGIPSFFLALQPNNERVTGYFLGDIFKRALPGALCVVIYTLAVSLFSRLLGLTAGETSLLSTACAAISCFYVLFKISRPMSLIKGLLFGALIAVFVTAVAFFEELLLISSLTGRNWLVFLAVAATVLPLNEFFTWSADRLGSKFDF